MPVNLIVALPMMAAITLPPDSTVHANGSIISLRMPISIVAHTVRSKIAGLKLSGRASACSLTSFRSMTGHQCDHIRLSLGGLSMAKSSLGTSQINVGGDEMTQDKFGLLGPAYGEIGEELAVIVGGDPDGVYLYAEAGDGWYGYSVFKDERDAVRYYTPSPELGELIYEAWLIEEPAKRWAVIGPTFRTRSRRLTRWWWQTTRF